MEFYKLVNITYDDYEFYLEKIIYEIISKISNDTWTNVNYTTVELAEFLLHHYNGSKMDLFC